MSQTFPTAFNQTVGSSDRLELLNNPAFRGSVLMNLDAHLFVANSIAQENIPKGYMFKEFIRWSNIGSEIHDIGDEVLAMGTRRNKNRIYLDERPRVSMDSFDDIEEYLSDMSAQQKTAERMGVELAQAMEIESIKLPILASRTAMVDGDFLGGGLDNNGTAAALGTGTPAALAATLLTRLDEIDEHFFDIAMNDPRRTVLIDSPVWYALRGLDNVFPGNHPFFSNEVTRGAAPDPSAFSDINATLFYKGFAIIRSQLASKVFRTNRTTDRFRPGNFSSTMGVVYAPECAALIRSRGITMEAWRNPNTQSNHVLSSLLLGGGTIYPEKAIEITGTYA